MSQDPSTTTACTIALTLDILAQEFQSTSDQVLVRVSSQGEGTEHLWKATENAPECSPVIQFHKRFFKVPYEQAFSLSLNYRCKTTHTDIRKGGTGPVMYHAQTASRFAVLTCGTQVYAVVILRTGKIEAAPLATLASNGAACKGFLRIEGKQVVFGCLSNASSNASTVCYTMTEYDADEQEHANPLFQVVADGSSSEAQEPSELVPVHELHIGFGMIPFPYARAFPTLSREEEEKEEEKEKEEESEILLHVTQMTVRQELLASAPVWTFRPRRRIPKPPAPSTTTTTTTTTVNPSPSSSTTTTPAVTTNSSAASLSMRQVKAWPAKFLDGLRAMSRKLPTLHFLKSTAPSSSSSSSSSFNQKVSAAAATSTPILPDFHPEDETEDEKKLMFVSPQFLYGVASGDPLAHQVILWTHARFPAASSTNKQADDQKSYVVENQPVRLRYQVATDSKFRNLVTQGTCYALPEHDFTVKVDVQGLEANTAYFYRFVYRYHECSPVGQTRTLPEADDDTCTQVQLAVLSCANVCQGYFHVYQEVARSSADVVLHVGDYIYEAGKEAYANQSNIVTLPSPENECVTLQDYRARYAQTRARFALQTLHASKPMIAVWDDHECVNDASKSGSHSHNAALYGSYEARKQAAIQAYHEWLPIRTGNDKNKIYRRFEFGNLVSLHMLDTRMAGRDLPIRIEDLLNPNTTLATQAELFRETREMLGAEQVQWLIQGMAQSSAKWQVLGQQILMGKIMIPLEILEAFNPTSGEMLDPAQAMQSVVAYLGKVAANPDYANQVPRLGMYLDSWDGYLAAREILLQTIFALQKKLVVLSGDSHNAWHNDLVTLSGVKVGEEFATPSVSSPGSERDFYPVPPAQLESLLLGVVPDVKWCNASQRGYLLATFTPERMEGEFCFVDQVAHPSLYTTQSVSRQFGQAKGM